MTLRRSPSRRRDDGSVLAGVKAEPSGWPPASPDTGSGRRPYRPYRTGDRRSTIRQNHVSTVSGDCQNPSRHWLSDLDITRSHSRPRTSNDNPYSEAQFKTMKYLPDYPDRFDSIGHARAWMDGFIGHYNHEHYHSGIGYYTPASIHHGTAETVRELRQTTLDAAYAEHPERFARRPHATKPPTVAHINDPARRRTTEPAKPELTTTSHLI